MSAIKNADEVLRQSGGILLAVLNAAPDAMVVIDPSGKIVLANSLAETMFGYPKDELLGQPEEMLMPTRFHAHHRAHREGYVFALETRMMGAEQQLWGQHKTGTEFPVEINLSSLETERGILIFSSIRDTTEQMKADIALRKSEERYHYLFNQMDEGYCIIELIFDEQQKAIDWQYLEVNTSFEKLTGLTNVVGKRIRQLQPSHEEYWFEIYGKVSQMGEPIRFISQAKGLEGRWFDLFAFRVGGAESKRVAVLFTNITAQKSAEDRLRISEIRYRRLFETARDGVLLLDPETRKITDANPYMTTLLGYTHEQLVGKELFEIGLFSDETASQEMVNKLKETHYIRYEDLPLRSQSGQRQEVEVVANLYDENGHPVIQCNIRGITERKVAQEVIENLNVRLQRSVAEAQHRIKNNLQVLSALVELQVPSKAETVSITEFKRIGHHIRTLAALHDLMTINSHVESGQDMLSLKTALETLLPMLQATSGGRPIRLIAEEMMISLNQGSSFTLLVNELVSNALKHGQGEIMISLTLLPGALAQLAVSDHGPGFPPDFDPLKSAKTGIELIESMGRWDLHGEVAYQNLPGNGGKVLLTFPLPDQN